jgi:hypothetical protein
MPPSSRFGFYTETAEVVAMKVSTATGRLPAID